MTVALDCAAQCDLEILGFSPLTTNITLVVNDGHCGTEADSVGEFLLGITFDPPLLSNPWPCMYDDGWASLIFPLDFPAFNIGEGDDDIIYVPNAFTPNNDGKNDVFQPVLTGDCWLWYRFQVFNRWGKKVFESDYPGDAWRGEVNTKWGRGESYCADGVYMWMITGQKYGNVWTDLHGQVTLLR